MDLKRQASRILDQTLSELNQRAWPEAFASGRILVFEFVGGIWELMPPHCWENAPPFELNMTRAETKRMIEERFYAPGNTGCHSNQGGGLCVVLKPIPDKPLHLLSLPPSMTGDFHPDLLSNPSGRFSYLFSADLPEDVFSHGLPPPLREKLDRVLEARRWFRGVIYDARRRGKRAFQEMVFDNLEPFRITDVQKQEIWGSQRPAAWGRYGRIPKDLVYSISERPST